MWLKTVAFMFPNLESICLIYFTYRKCNSKWQQVTTNDNKANFDRGSLTLLMWFLSVHKVTYLYPSKRTSRVLSVFVSV